MASKGFRGVAARLWRSVWQRHAPVVAKKDDKDTGRGRTDARARFWTEFREGQREAEAHNSRSR
jgi:hypothetical protein